MPRAKPYRPRFTGVDPATLGPTDGVDKLLKFANGRIEHPTATQRHRVEILERLRGLLDKDPVARMVITTIDTFDGRVLPPTEEPMPQDLEVGIYNLLELCRDRMLLKHCDNCNDFFIGKRATRSNTRREFCSKRCEDEWHTVYGKK